jgi:alpha-ketoglutarate-dependent taurine dioxygenase
MTNNWLNFILSLSTLAATAQSFGKQAFIAPTPPSLSSAVAELGGHRKTIRKRSTALSYVIEHSNYPSVAEGFDINGLKEITSQWHTTEDHLTTTNIDQVDISFGLPILVRPTERDHQSLSYLSRFLKEQRGWIDTMITRHGAILFRGFNLDTAQDVEDAVRSYNPQLNNQYRGTSPRNKQGGTDYVFSAAEVPSHWPIAQHLEMSFLPSPPKQLYFSALQAPTTIGGETAVADFRQVYRDLPRKLREKLSTKKLRYTRTHRKVGTERNTHDVASMLSWPELFGTSDPQQVERLAAGEGMPLRWEGKNKDIFVSEFQSEPFQLHPDTNEPVFFNHANVFHWTSFPAELFAAFRRTKDLRFLGHALKVTVKSVILYGILRRKMALHVAFGDGTPITILEMHHIRKAVHKNMVFNRWQKGDLLLLDNFSTSHGRQPTYDKGRNIVVAWSDPLEKANKTIEL